jgi:hypothetical protein
VNGCENVKSSSSRCNKNFGWDFHLHNLPLTSFEIIIKYGKSEKQTDLIVKDLQGFTRIYTKYLKISNSSWKKNLIDNYQIFFSIIISIISSSDLTASGYCAFLRGYAMQIAWRIYVHKKWVQLFIY